MECSSKEMIGVDEIFEKALDIVVANDPSNINRNRNIESRASNYVLGGDGDGMVVRRKKRKCNFL